MIVTPRLVLRRARMDDLDDLHAVFADPRAMRFWDTPPHTDVEQTRGWLEGMVALPPDRGCDFVLEHDGRAVGKAGCWCIHPDGITGEVGVILHPDLWGRGLAREALDAAIPRMFADLPVARLEADVDPRNGPALRLLEGVGFRVVRTAPRTVLVGGEWCDSVYLQLERPAP